MTNCVIATVGKITGEILAPGETMTKEARDILIDCCVEFITMISSEANDTMEREAKKTIAPEHVAAALKELGFPEYINEVLASANDQKEQLKTREKRTTKMEQSGMSQEELEEAQKALFAQATEKYTNNQ